MSEDQQQEQDARIRRQTIEDQPVKKVSSRIIVQRIIYYFLGIVVVLLSFRITLLLLAANQGAPFVDFIYTVSGFFAGPFYGIFSYQPTYGQSTFEISSIVAILVYALIALGIAKLTMLTSHER